MAEYAGSDEPARAGAEGERFSVRRMARLLQVSSSGYYAYAKPAGATELTPRQQRRADADISHGAESLSIEADHGADFQGVYGSAEKSA